MYLVFYLQVCFVLVSSNPLYDFNCCPHTYSSYGNDQPLVQRGNYNPYPLSLLLHNNLNPITNAQSVSPQCQYLNTNNFVPNYQFYNQNDLDMLQYVPETDTQKVINNYILIPQEYYQNNANEDECDKKNREEISIKNVIKKNKRNKNKRRKSNMSAKVNNGDADLSNLEIQTKKSRGYKEETKNDKDVRKKSKNKINKIDSNQPKTDVIKAISLKKVQNQEEVRTKYKNNDKNFMETNSSPSNKLKYQETKTMKGSIKKEPVNDSVQGVNRKSKKKDDTGLANVKVSFDINEDCTDLDCRHTRNKDVNKKYKPKTQQELPNNLNNYMNSFTLDQQMNPNFFNPNANLPFNFDYLYQKPQTSNIKPKEPNNRGRNRKRKPPTPNRQANSKKKTKSTITIVDNCDKVVELTPEIPKIETTTLATNTTAYTEEPQTNNVILGEITVEKDQDSNLENQIPTSTETLHTDVLSNDDISNNNNVPFDNYNDVIDEYYPDFTLDNTYISSKENDDLNNFHDRHYYIYGDEPELNKNRLKYETSNDNALNCDRKLNISNQSKNILQEPSQIQEIICKTDTAKEKVTFSRPLLEFPGFKTEMINKEKYFGKEEYHRSNNYDINNISMNNIFPSKQADGKENQNNNNVEMTFANSKVVRYGAPEKEEEVILKIPEPEFKKEFKNLISSDGKTTVVIARSLDYSY